MKPPRFVVPLKSLEYIDGFNWRVESQVIYYSAVLDAAICVPIGRVTDFASIPRGLWWAYPPTKYAQPATIHDELYTLQELDGKPVTRAQSDAVFLEALGVCGVPYLRRYGFYWALRAAGWAAWNSHTREKEALARK